MHYKVFLLNLLLMKEVRCIGKLKSGDDCNQMLGRFNSVNGQIKCPRCKTYNNITTLIESVSAPYQDRISLTKKQKA